MPIWRSQASVSSHSGRAAKASRSQGMGAREIERPSGKRAYYLDHVGIEQRLDVGDGFSEGGDGCLGIVVQPHGDLIDQPRRNQRFVSLYVDQHRVVIQRQQLGNLGQPVGTGRMVGAGHDHFGTQRGQGIADAIIIGGNDHAAGRTRRSPPPYMGHHGFAGDIEQRLARQAR